jgi:hypothetical protein
METRREVEGQLEAYEILYLLTVLKKKSMNLILLKLSCECTNELLSYMFTLVIIF